VYRAANQEIVFVTGAAGKLYQNVKALNGTTWSGFYEVPVIGPETFTSAPSALSPN
jgi:hypothetical protein